MMHTPNHLLPQPSTSYHKLLTINYKLLTINHKLLTINYHDPSS